MPLPTAKTDGYGTFRGRVACDCLIAWLPVYEAELLRRKIIKHNIDIYQLTGGSSKSGGTHSQGGAFDIAQTQTEAVKVAREMGADATWHRPYNWDNDGGGAHTHGVLRGCPHNAPARYQITSTLYGVDHGHNGLANRGKDTGPKPLSHRTWTQGITWAKKQGAIEAKARIMSYNFPGPDKLAKPTERIAAAMDLILPAKPSIIGWNELVGPVKAGKAIVGGDGKYESGSPSPFALATDAALGENFYIMTPTRLLNENYISWNKTEFDKVAQYADTILPSKTGGRHLTRGVLKHRASGKPLAIGQTHFVNDGGAQGELDRQAQGKLSLESMMAVSAKHDHCPFIIQGDMNTAATIAALLNAGMKNGRLFADEAQNRGATTYTNKTKTKPSTDPKWVIDQQYGTAGIYYVGYTVLLSLTSAGLYVQPRPGDHDPIITSVRF